MEDLNMKVLVVDDDPLYLELLHFTLSGEGYEVLTAQDPDAVPELAAQSHPDVILSDVSMPEVDGYSMAMGLKADPRTAGIPLIFVTARSGDDGRREGAHAGATAYLTKPFSTENLIAAIQRVGNRVREKGGN